MKQEINAPVILTVAVAIVAVLGFVLWRVLTPPVDAALLESRVGPGGKVAAPPASMMPGANAPVGAGPMAPPGVK